MLLLIKVSEKSLENFKKNNFEPMFSDPKFCGDNAAMIAWAGIQRYKKNLIDDLNVKPKIKMGLRCKGSLYERAWA